MKSVFSLSKQHSGPGRRLLSRGVTHALVLVVIFSGCKQEEHARWEFVRDDGKVFEGTTTDLEEPPVSSRNPWTGTLTMWTKDGNKLMQNSYQNGKDHGLCTFWAKNGRKVAQMTYNQGKREGKYLRWYANGQKKKEEGIYEDGEPVGVWTSWYPSGQKRYEMDLRNGKREGETRVWDEAGKLLAKGIYVANKPWQGSFFLEEGYIQYYRSGELVSGNVGTNGRDQSRP